MAKVLIHSLFEFFLFLIVRIIGQTFLLNNDLTIYQQLNGTALRSLTTALKDWMVLGDHINQAQWRLGCRSTGQTFASSTIWILTGSGNATASVKLPATLPCPIGDVQYSAFVYPWNAANPFADRIASYSS